MRVRYKIGFVDFHSSFCPRGYGLVKLLDESFDLEIVDANDEPDFLFFSVYGYGHRDLKYDRCTKIFTCEENIRPPWGECDYAVTGDHVVGMGLRHLRVPIYAKCLEEHDADLVKTFDPEKVLAGKTSFCSFVVSCRYARHRQIFFESLSRYKRVDSGGRWLNNVGGPVPSKMDFIRGSKFNIAFENSRYSGYMTEKIVEAMMAECIPIYWGDRFVSSELNPDSFVDANEPEGCLTDEEWRRHFDTIVEVVARLDGDDDAYLRMLSEPWLHYNRPVSWTGGAISFFRRIFEQGPSNYWRRRDSRPPQDWPELEGRDWMLPGYWGGKL